MEEVLFPEDWENERYRYVLENIQDVIWEMKPNMVFTFVSPSAKEMSGYEAKEMLGRSLLEFLTKESREYILSQWQQNIAKRTGKEFKEIILYDVEFKCKDGSTIWVEVSVKPVYKSKCFFGYIGTTRDISSKKKYENEMRKAVEELQTKNRKLDELATLDMLTGIFNRRKFEHLAQLAVENAQRYGTPFSILMFDIDQFKQINDSYGHKKGDQVLSEVTMVVRHTLRDSDMLFRWGGDEFMMLLPEVTSERAVRIAEKVRSTVELHCFCVQGHNVTISIGVVEYSFGECLDELVTRVDKALIRAKAGGKNKVEVGLMPD